MLKQVCIIPFRRDFLLKYNSIQPTELEIIESIDMNRLLQNNIKIRMIFRTECTYSVDTNADLLKVNKLMDKDKLLEKYNI
jgi:3-deoxy-manno-octulosonate cytidylyltransferase (CMP-KDO synthetase)